MVESTEIVRAIGRRDRELAARLLTRDQDLLGQDSALPGWSVLTIVCHLRYGADATLRMTEGILAGLPTSYYPHGRSTQRGSTLRPSAEESPRDVVASLIERSASLERRWSDLAPGDWDLVLQEPSDNVDLGPVSLRALAILRLTEVEVHGTDLALGLSAWSDEFVFAALPMRLDWLARRRSNHRQTAALADGVWRLAAHDGPSVLVRLSQGHVAVVEDGPTPGGAAIIEGTASDLLGFLLGRTPLARLQVSGDQGLAPQFSAAFPAP